MKNLKVINPNVANFIGVLNDDGIELMDMFEEYQELSKNSKAAKAIEYYILNGPYSKYIAHKFTDTSSAEDFLNMVYDVPTCCRPEQEFLEGAIELLADEFSLEKTEKGKIVSPESFKITVTTSNLLKLSIRVQIPMQDIRNEYMIDSNEKGIETVKGFLKDTTYSYFMFNKILKKYMSAHLTKLYDTRRVEFVISEKAFLEDNFVCTLSLLFAPSRANFETIDELHKLVDYIINEYGVEIEKKA